MADACAVQQGRPKAKGLAMAAKRRWPGRRLDSSFGEFFFIKIASNEKCFNYKVIDLFENYNFHIKFIFI
jgi:hypothetical protein